MTAPWDRRLWGVEWVAPPSAPMLIGALWTVSEPGRGYIGEPTRPLLFTTRRHARQWCAEKMAQYAGRTDSLRHWTFRAVRVREIVGIIGAQEVP